METATVTSDWQSLRSPSRSWRSCRGGRHRSVPEEDALTIEPGPLRGAEIDTYDDHRMAMAFSLAGLRIPGVIIRDPGCVSKTWPEYFAFLDRLY